jgi:hypothetical protein
VAAQQALCRYKKINNLMLLHEVFDPPVQGMQDVNSDNSKPVYRTSRKTKLTLKQIRKLRRMLDVRNYERKIYLQKVKKQYGSKTEGGAGGPSI